MPKRYRLSHADFVRLPKAARRLHGEYFSLSITPAPFLKGSRAACVVSKRVSARSVDRNRIERLCRESLRPRLARLREPIAFIFFAKREAAAASFKEVERDIEKLLARAA